MSLNRQRAFSVSDLELQRIREEIEALSLQQHRRHSTGSTSKIEGLEIADEFQTQSQQSALLPSDAQEEPSEQRQNTTKDEVVILPPSHPALDIEQLLTQPDVSTQIRKNWDWNQSPSPWQKLVTFPRKYLSYHPVHAFIREIVFRIDPIPWLGAGVGLATFQQILISLQICSIGLISKHITSLSEFASGASFKVFRGLAKEDYHFPPLRESQSRCQWKKNEPLALKKPILSLIVRQMQGGVRDRSEQMCLRSTIQEIRILNHKPLRDHPNLIRVFGVAWQDDVDEQGRAFPVPYLVQELAKHGNLRQYLLARRGTASSSGTRNSVTTKLEFCRGVAAGMEALHQCAIVHGDLKCDNVLVCSDDNGNFIPKLTDFGFSSITSLVSVLNYFPNRRVTVMGGSRRYMAPEVFVQLEDAVDDTEEGRSTVSVPLGAACKIDIYSYGLLAAEICLDGNDIFAALVLCFSPGAAEIRQDQAVFDTMQEKYIVATKNGGLDDDMAVQLIVTIIAAASGDGVLAEKILPVLQKTLTRDPDARLSNISDATRNLVDRGSEEINIEETQRFVYHNPTYLSP